MGVALLYTAVGTVLGAGRSPPPCPTVAGGANYGRLVLTEPRPDAHHHALSRAPQLLPIRPQTREQVILTEFPSVLYNFVSDDGRMVSHSRYESKVFGSGWFNADGRVVVLPASEGGTNEASRQTVQVSSTLRLHHRRSPRRNA